MRRILFALFILLDAFAVAGWLSPMASLMPGLAPAVAHAQPSSSDSKQDRERRIYVINTPEDFDRLLLDLGDTSPGVRDDARRALNEMGEVAVPALIQLGLWNPDDLLRKNAVAALVKVGPSAIDPLIKALKGKEPRVRAGAAQALGVLSEKKAIAPLIEVLADRETIVRQEAFTSLIAIGSPATNGLIKALVHPSPSVRRNASVILRRIGRPTVQPLTQATSHANPGMRAAATRLLGQIGDPMAIPFLVKALRDPQEAVQELAVEAIVPFGQKAIDPLVAVLRENEPVFHGRAFSALTGIGKPVVPAFSALIADSKVDYNVRARAGKILRQLGWEPKDGAQRAWSHIVTGEWGKIPLVSQSIPPLMTTMADPLEPVRKAAAKAMVSFGARAVTPLATEILRQKSPLFHQGAATALENIRIRDFLAVEALTGLLRDSNSLPVQFAVVRALGKIGNYIAIEPLLKVAEDKERPLRIRMMAVDALGRLGDPRVTGRIVSILRRTKALPFQKVIIQTLGRLGDPAAAPPLIDRLADENADLRKLASLALVKLRPVPIALLIDALADPRPLVQKGASALLTKIGEPAVDQLIATLKKPDALPGIKANAEFLLIKVMEALSGDPNVMIKALDAPSDRVRLLAIQSLSDIKTIKSVPRLLDIAEQEWRYPKHLRDAAKAALSNVKDTVSPLEWDAVVEENWFARFAFLAPVGPLMLGLFSAFSGYWLTMSLVGVLLSFLLLRGPGRPLFFAHLWEQVVRKKDTPVSRAHVQKRLRAGLSSWQTALLPWLLLTSGISAALVWAKIIYSIAATFAVLGGLLAIGLWMQSPHGVERVSQLLDQRRRVSRFLFFPLIYLALLLFPATGDVLGQEEGEVQNESVQGEADAAPPPTEDEEMTPLARLLASFSRTERIDLLQKLGEQAARFPPTDPQEVLNIIFKEAESHLGDKANTRSFLTTLAPMAMQLSETVEEISETLTKMRALVGGSNSLVKLEQFFNEVLAAVDSKVLKGAFPIILELLQAGFFPNTELIEEAKTSTDRPLLYYSWRETVTTKINKGQFNISDSMHIAIHYTAFRQLTEKSQIMTLLEYRPLYTDYKRVVERWKKGSQKNAEQGRRLREIADQFIKFIANINERDWILVNPWLTRRLQEAFGKEDHPANQLFIINKTGVWITPAFDSVGDKIPTDLPKAPSQEMTPETASAAG
jgi:HEAT repeat protein